MGAPVRMLARNTLWQVTGQALPLLVGLASLPLIARGLGTERLGLLGLGWVVLGYVGVFDLGMGRAVTRAVAYAQGRGLAAQIPAVTWSAVSVQVITGLIGGGLLVTLTPRLVDILDVAPHLRTDATSTFRILAVAVPLVLIAGSFRGVLEGSRRFDLASFVSAPGSALNFALPLLGAISGWRLSTILWTLVGARCLSLAGYAVLAAGLVPALMREIRPTRDAFGQLWRFGLWTTVSGTMAPVLDQLDRVLLGAWTGVANVGYYTPSQELVLRTRVLPTALASALFAEFSMLAGQADRRESQEYYSGAIRALAVILGPLTLALILLGPDLLHLWLGEEFARRSAAAFRFLAAGVLLNALAHVPHAYLFGVNRPDIPAKLYLLELPIMLSLAWLLVPRWGIAGAGMTWAARAALDAALLFWAAERHGARGTRLVNGRTVMWTALAGLGTALAFVPGVNALGVYTRIGGTAVLCGSLAAVSWFALLDEPDRRRVRTALTGRRVS